MKIEESRENEIKEIVVNILDLDADEITRTSLFREDHDADSLLAIEILASLERTFNISIPQEKLSEMVNLEAVYTVVANATVGR